MFDVKTKEERNYYAPKHSFPAGNKVGASAAMTEKLRLFILSFIGYVKHRTARSAMGPRRTRNKLLTTVTNKLKK